jgi:hypothetical protein
MGEKLMVVKNSFTFFTRILPISPSSELKVRLPAIKIFKQNFKGIGNDVDFTIEYFCESSTYGT